MVHECQCGCIESHKKKNGLDKEVKILNKKKDNKPNTKEIFGNINYMKKKKK